MSAADDRALLVFLDSQDPQTLARLKALVDARTSKTPPPPTAGPATYLGIPVTASLHHNWDQVEASWWRAGVRATLAVAAPLVGDFIDPGACSLDHHGYCQEHGWFGEDTCPNERAQEFIAASEGEATTDE